ncbi:hypothetical protein D3C87_1744180 [compost metagenome]
MLSASAVRDKSADLLSSAVDAVLRNCSSQPTELVAKFMMLLLLSRPDNGSNAMFSPILLMKPSSRSV